MDSAPRHDQPLFTLGSYEILRSIGKGGMGEVYLAYDTICKREIALKRVRPDLSKNAILHQRFLREARITGQLTHPAIIPIYSIHQNESDLYYTMPYVEGKTFREILSYARKREKQGLKPDHSTSIPSLIRILLSICQAVAYAHSKGVIHRDLKPNNVMVGQFGEVFILDWGLAKWVASTESEELEVDLQEETSSQEITHLGKVVGTLAYMAPEQALGKPPSYSTDIYALGVTLYQILTLHFPFIRHNLQEFKESWKREVLVDPATVSPYRDIPPALSRVALKCLSPDEKERYPTVESLIHDLESYIEGRSEWILAANLDIRDKSHWEFQEHILLAEHVAITRGPETSHWVSLMISSQTFPGNNRITAEVELDEHGQGVGFLLCIPDQTERSRLGDGYSLWIGSDINRNTRLLRDSVEVLHAPDIFLQRGLSYRIRIEKIGNSITLTLNDSLQFSYVSYLPLPGTRVGFFSRDEDFKLRHLEVYLGSDNLTVECLAIPDAFLAYKLYEIALNEYRRIAQSFSGTAEGREALFRAGITLLEEARHSSTEEAKIQKSEAAMEEFSKLRSTPGAPLEYLGKALAYQMLHDYEEEFKCFEIAHRRYKDHPLLPMVQDQLVYRMHESSRDNRSAAYHFILLAVLHPSPATKSMNTKKLFANVKKHGEKPPFISGERRSAVLSDLTFAIELAFWLAKPLLLSEIIDQLHTMEHTAIPVIFEALFALMELRAWQMVDERMINEGHRIKEHPGFIWMEVALLCHKAGLEAAFEGFLELKHDGDGFFEWRTALYLMEQAIREHKPKVIYALYERYMGVAEPLPAAWQIQLDSYRLWALLQERRWGAAGDILHNYTFEQLTQESTPLHFLYGCWLAATEGKEIAQIHFAILLEGPYPRSWSAFSMLMHRGAEAKQQWLQRAFSWEKRIFYLQSELFYHCLGDEATAQQAHTLAEHP